MLDYCRKSSNVLKVLAQQVRIPEPYHFIFIWTISYINNLQWSCPINSHSSVSWGEMDEESKLVLIWTVRESVTVTHVVGYCDSCGFSKKWLLWQFWLLEVFLKHLKLFSWSSKSDSRTYFDSQWLVMILLCPWSSGWSQSGQVQWRWHGCANPPRAQHPRLRRCF